jgi:hypothetical protein
MAVSVGVVDRSADYLEGAVVVLPETATGKQSVSRLITPSRRLATE